MHLEELVVEILILVLMVNGCEICVKVIIAQIIMMLVLINITSNVKHHYDFEKNNG